MITITASDARDTEGRGMGAICCVFAPNVSPAQGYEITNRLAPGKQANKSLVIRSARAASGGFEWELLAGNSDRIQACDFRRYVDDAAKRVGIGLKSESHDFMAISCAPTAQNPGSTRRGTKMTPRVSARQATR